MLQNETVKTVSVFDHLVSTLVVRRDEYNILFCRQYNLSLCEKHQNRHNMYTSLVQWKKAYIIILFLSSLIAPVHKRNEGV